jgi:hypothetical protein
MQAPLTPRLDCRLHALPSGVLHLGLHKVLPQVNALFLRVLQSVAPVVRLQGRAVGRNTLLLAFVALASAALFITAGGSISTIWNVANAKLNAAATSANK